MTLSASTAQRHFVDHFVREKVACCYDVAAFEILALTPFCMEILGVRKWIIQCFNGVFSAKKFWLESGKNMQEYVHFLYFFTIVLQIFRFFSRARSTAGEGGTEKYQPWYQPPYQPST